MQRSVCIREPRQYPLAVEVNCPAEVPAFTPVIAACEDCDGHLPAAELVAAGTTLIHQGNRVRTVHLVRAGLLKLIYVSASGREVTVGLRSVGWYAGSTSVLLNNPSVYTVQTVTSCALSRLPALDFSRYVRHNAGVLDHFLKNLCLEIASQAGHQVSMMSSSAEDRLDHFMRERSTANSSHKVFDPLPSLKQMEIAQLLSITPEHLSRLMHKKKAATLSGAERDDMRHSSA